MKQIKWNSKAKEFVRSLDKEARIEIGALLMLLQEGEVLIEPQSKAMKSIHKNAYELRIKDRHGVYRVIYVLCLKDKILIPHAFVKKTQKTLVIEIKRSIERLKVLLNEN